MAHFHEAALTLAEAHGLLDRPEVKERLAHLPGWLIELQAPGGFAALEQAFGITVPGSLRAFWGLPRLVCLLDAWGPDTVTSVTRCCPGRNCGCGRVARS